jgi:exopolysaccharide production protein ExoZ
MTERNQSLDVLRGMAILLVLLGHCAWYTTSMVAGLGSFASNHGEMGVQLFFIVSGYTMMLTYGDRVDPAAACSFYIRRVFRIVPLFWLAIIFYVLMTKGEGLIKLWAPDGIGARDILLTFFFLHWVSVTALNSVVPGGWSIAVEMQFYLLFPLIIYVFRRHNGPISIYAAIAVLSVVGQFAAQRYLVPQLAATLPANQAYLADAFFYCWLPRQLICFGFGILLHQCIEQKNPPTLGVLLLIGAGLCWAWSDSWGAQIVVLFALSFVILALNVTVSLMTLLGRHSYAIYLTHFACAAAISSLMSLDLIPMFVLVTGASLGVSYYVIEPLFERRFNRLGHALAARARRAKILASAA